VTTAQRIRIRRVLLVVCAMAGVWAILMSLTGGFVVRIGSMRVSSRTPVNAIVLALVAGLAAVALAVPDWRGAIRADRTWFQLVGAAALASLQRRWRRLQQTGIALPAAIVGAGLIVYQWTIARPFFLDEEMIAINVRDRTLTELTGSLWLGQSAPYGWLVLERASLLTLGTSEQALRLVPALFGIATMAAAFWIGRRWMNAFGASTLVLLCAVGQWLSFFSVVLKHYSADAFWALLLPALGAWAVDGNPRDRPTHTRRAAMWWMISAAGQWVANGALFVTPGCALVLMSVLWRRYGWTAARNFALVGLAWLACFGLHYFLSIRHAVNSAYLQGYWTFAMAPASGGLASMLTWLPAQLPLLADRPGGTNLWIPFWLCTVGGLALTMRSPLALMFATVPASAFVLAAFRMVPLYERLSLWTVPAIYVGIALFVEQVTRIAHDAFVARRWIRFAAAIVAVLIALQLCVDIFRRGRNDLRYGRSPDDNQQLNDRAAVQWLMRHARPGDAIMTTRLALPAVWWYAGVPITDRNSAGGGRDAETPVFEVDYRPAGTACERTQVRDTLKGRRRALIYFGFRFGIHEEFDSLLLRNAEELGSVSAYSEFARAGRAAVVDVVPGKPATATPSPGAGGCIAVRSARRW